MPVHVHNHKQPHLLLWVGVLLRTGGISSILQELSGLASEPFQHALAAGFIARNACAGFDLRRHGLGRAAWAAGIKYPEAYICVHGLLDLASIRQPCSSLLSALRRPCTTSCSRCSWPGDALSPSAWPGYPLPRTSSILACCSAPSERTAAVRCSGPRSAFQRSLQVNNIEPGSRKNVRLQYTLRH